eukprot:1901026-Rhodomonas_salina.6
MRPTAACACCNWPLTSMRLVSVSMLSCRAAASALINSSSRPSVSQPRFHAPFSASFQSQKQPKTTPRTRR